MNVINFSFSKMEKCSVKRRSKRRLTRKADAPSPDDISLPKRPFSIVLENCDYLSSVQSKVSAEKTQSQVTESEQVEEQTETVDVVEVAEDVAASDEGSSGKKRKQYLPLLHNNHTWHRNKGINNEETVYYDCGGK